MWKASAGIQISSEPVEEEDWETDPDFINDVSEEEQRWGSKTVVGSGRAVGAIDMDKLRFETEKAYNDNKKKQLEEQNPGYGYGGKFGIQSDRMDKSAMGHDYICKIEKHTSQKDYTTGFGGKFGVQKDRVDQSAAGWDYKEKVEKHGSQKDYVTGFGGKFGIQKDRVDKSAVGWDHVEIVEKHESQKDYSKGFGGKFGVQEDRKDKSAFGWDHIEALQQHESQLDHKVGFGGKFGIQNDRMDKSAARYERCGQKEINTSNTREKPLIESIKPSHLRAKFENLAKNAEEEKRKYNEEQMRNKEKKNRLETSISATEDVLPTVPIATQNLAVPKQKDGIGKFTNICKDMDAVTNEFNIEAKKPTNISNESKIIKYDLQDNIEKSGAGTITKKISNENNSTQPANQSEGTILAISMEGNKCNQAENVPIIDTLPEEATYGNLENLADYIEDTGIKAIALYDYQAADDDEISFDPDDEVTHIEMIDEGWWRGLCKNRFGLFPANYVQLIQ